MFPAHFIDGTANTILIVEAGKAVPWTKPADLPYVADAPIPELGGIFPDSFHAAFADGDVHRLTKNYNEFNLRRYITSNDGQVLFDEQVMARSAAAELRSKNRDLHQNLDDVRERLRMMRDERDVLQGRSASAKDTKDTKAHLEALKKENARLQKELEKLRDEMESLSVEINQSLQKHSKKKG